MSTSASDARSGAIAGTWFDAASSRGVPASMSARTDGGRRVRLQVERGGLPTIDASLDDVAVSDRLAQVPRRLTFPGGASFETTDNDAVDALLTASGRRGSLVHFLEARWGIALASLVAVAAISVLFLRFGLPAIAGQAASRVPDDVADGIGRQAMQVLDGRAFRKSRLPDRRQQELQRLFSGMTAGLGGRTYVLELRDAPRLGANAIALPARTIVLTDQLAALARDDEELQAVLAHELGHLEARHSLRTLFQSAGISALAAAIFGDVSSLYALATAAPVLLQAQHSRELEREADGYSRQWLDRAGIPEDRFDAILCRIAGEHGDRATVAWLSTHPRIDDRAKCAGPG